MNMTAGQHAILAYAISVALLWGYGLTLWLSARAQKQNRDTD